MSKPRLIAIVLHGGGPYYLDPLLASGRVPSLARLIAEGSHRRLISPYPLSASAWVTILTGQSVATHGVIDYLQVDARSYHAMTTHRVETDTYRDRTIFGPLSAQGRRTASIYLPMTHPPFPLDGIMITGFPTPDEERPATWPSGLSATLGRLNLGRLADVRYEHRARIREHLEFHLEKISSVILDACRDPQYDVVLGCLSLPDLAHHYFWTGDSPEALEPIYRIYEQVDAAIARVLDTAGEDDYVVVFSDHGSRAAPRRLFTINRWLQERGDLRLASPALQQSGAIDLVNRVVRGARRLRLNQRLTPWLPSGVRSRVSAVTQNDIFVDWGRSRAYGMNFFYPLVGVEVNLRGRQARGIVNAGPEYESLVAELGDALADLRDPATGRLVCREVRRGADMFAGPHVDRFPDVIGVLDADYDSRTQLGDAVCGENTFQWEYPYMGYHDSEATFAIRGPGITPGSTGPTVHLVDIAPTLLHLVGVPRPEWMDGRSFIA